MQSVGEAGRALQQPLQYLKGVGPRRAADLHRAGLVTVEDLLLRFPLRYEDRGHFQTIASLRPGQTASVAGEILSCGVRATRRPGFKIFEAVIRDPSGFLRAVWLNQPFLRDVLRPHQAVVLYGALEVRTDGRLQLTNPQYEIVQTPERAFPDSIATAEEDDEGADTIHTGRIVPVYEKAGSVTPKMQRRLVYEVLQHLPPLLPDVLPASIRASHGFPDYRTALAETHFPPEGTSLDALNRFGTPAQRRLIYEEFFLFQLGLVWRREERDREAKPRPVRVDDRIRQAARAVLPFRLTGDQRQALKAIVEDMQRSRPMNRLLQGDVGSGKTIVALLAALVAMENGFQVAFMAPTEILADQHAATIRRLLARSRFRVGALTGTASAAERRETAGQIARGELDLIVGTHALVQDPVTFRDLGLVVIDEQHRFGVIQRAALRDKGLHPDVLVMTATPIPRTLAMTTYGDLDVSTIRELPPGRHPIRTVVKPEGRRAEIYAFIRRQLEQGRQAYIVYPLIEESEKIDLKAATEMADHLAQEVFPHWRVALLHGRMKADARERVMERFVAGDLHVLVSTTVIEVGVDVPNASVMLIEHAERFGLAQLHQLRGRVGRGPHESFCVLLYQAPLSEPGRARLKALAETTDGFVIAERDLELRGPGDFFGTRQSGVPTLRVGDLVRDQGLMQQARRDAWRASGEGLVPPDVEASLRATWSARFGLVGVG